MGDGTLTPRGKRAPGIIFSKGGCMYLWRQRLEFLRRAGRSSIKRFDCGCGNWSRKHAKVYVCMCVCVFLGGHNTTNKFFGSTVLAVHHLQGWRRACWPRRRPRPCVSPWSAPRWQAPRVCNTPIATSLTWLCSVCVYTPRTRVRGART